MWVEIDLLLPGQIPLSLRPDQVKVRKRKAEEALKLHSKEEEESFSVWASDLPGDSQPNGETGGPTGGEGLQGFTANQVLPDMSHVADHRVQQPKPFGP